jgi:hypothetical protein
MEYVEGLDLARMVKARGPMPVGHACHHARQAALGLQHAHERGMVHRDIKPGNLMLSRDGNRAIIKVLDFGLAKAGRENKLVELGLDRGEDARGAASALTLAGQMLGTPDFIAPEQIDDAQRADIRADIYSLGCTLYYLLSGGPPFRAATLYDVLQAHHSMDAAPLNLARPEVPAELAALVAKMMAKEPERRFREPGEVAKALAPFFKKITQAAVAAGFGDPQVDPPAASLSTAGLTQVATSPAPPPACTPPTEVTRNANRPEEMWKSLIDFSESEEARPAAAVATEPVRKPPRRLWPAMAGVVGLGAILLSAVITYRIATDKGELVIETDDPNIEVVVKQGGKLVTIIDTQTKNRIALDSGNYELELPGDKPGLRLSTKKFSSRRGDRTVVTVSRELATPEPKPPTTVTSADPPQGPARQATPEPKPPMTVTSAKHPRGPARQAIALAGNTFLTAISFLPDGKHAVTVGRGPNMILWDLSSRRVIGQFDDHPDTVWSVSVSPDGALVATGGQDFTGTGDFRIRVWDLRTGEVIGRLSGCTDTISGLRFSPDGKRLYVTCWDKHLRSWQVLDGSLQFASSASQALTSLDVSLDGEQIATGTDHGEVLLWNSRSGRSERTLAPQDSRGTVEGVAFLPSGRQLLANHLKDGGNAVLWDLERTAIQRTFRGHKGGTYMAVVSPDGRLVAAGGEHDHRVRLWDVETGEEVDRVEGFEGPVRALAFSPDGLSLLAGGKGGRIKYFPVPPRKGVGAPY